LKKALVGRSGRPLSIGSEMMPPASENGWPPAPNRSGKLIAGRAPSGEGGLAHSCAATSGMSTCEPCRVASSDPIARRQWPQHSVSSWPWQTVEDGMAPRGTLLLGGGLDLMD